MNLLSYYRPRLLRPRSLTAVSAPLLLCSGIIAILSWAAPEYLQAIIPGWRDKWGVVLVIAVTFGFCRAVLRLTFRAAGVMFWAMALACLLGTSIHALPESLKTLQFPKLSVPFSTQGPRTQQSQASRKVSALTLLANRGAPALPDEAYFGAPRSTLPSDLPIPPQMGELFRRFNLR